MSTLSTISHATTFSMLVLMGFMLFVMHPPAIWFIPPLIIWAFSAGVSMNIDQ